MDNREEGNEKNETAWSPAESGMDPMFSIQETAGLMAEHIRMRADLDKLSRENEELRRSHDALYRLLSEKTQAKPDPDLRSAVRDILSEWKDEDGKTVGTVIGPIPSMEDMGKLERVFAEAIEGIKGVSAGLAGVSGQAGNLEGVQAVGLDLAVPAIAERNRQCLQHPSGDALDGHEG